MASLGKVPNATVTLLLFVALLFSLHYPTGAQLLGVSYGKFGNNLPSPQQVVNLYKSNGIQLMRIYSPDQAVLKALPDSGIQLVLGILNSDLRAIAQDKSCTKANQWIETNVVPYACYIRYIVVGNEVLQPDRQYVGPALQNVQTALNAANLQDQMKVTTSIGSDLIMNSYPPSKGEFTDLPFMTPIIDILNSIDSPLLVNIYPYFSADNNPLDYQLFTSPGTVVTDPNGLEYQNLFDALVDAVYAAISKVSDLMDTTMTSAPRAPQTKIVVSESGWPSAGGRPHHRNAAAGMYELDGNPGKTADDTDTATVAIAGTYYRNLISHVQQQCGTPLVPDEPLEVYLFAMFDENQKPGNATEQHFGLFTPNQQPKYGQLDFSS